MQINMIGKEGLMDEDEQGCQNDCHKTFKCLKFMKMYVSFN